MKRLLIFAAAASTVAAADIAPINRLIPPKGAEIAQADAMAIEAELAAVGKFASGIAKHPLAPDVEIYLNAVAFALENGEWEKPGDVELAKQQLATAKTRVTELLAGKPSWITKTGGCVRGYRSQIDGSAQPFGVDIPEGYDFKGKPGNCYVWLHGRGEKETNLYFIRNREKGKGQFQPPPGTIQIHPFGRQCLGFKSAAEMDIIDAVAAAQKMYPISPDHVALMGFSMGGAGAWQAGAHFTDHWAVVHAGAGFVDVEKFTKADRSKLPGHEVTLWGVYDVPGYARNFLNIPLVGYSGEIDGQRAAGEIMQAALKAEGLEMKHYIGPKMGHKYHPEVQKQVQADIDTALTKGRNTKPSEIHFQTKTLRYNKYAWVSVLGLEEHWKDSRVDAKIEGPVLKVTTTNISQLSLVGAPSHASIEIDGTKLEGVAGTLNKVDGKWASAKPGTFVQSKRPGLQGPMDDALMTPFLVVLPGKASANPQLERWVKFEQAHFEKMWREMFRGRLRVKKDSEVTAKDIADYNLILWGDPASNSVIGKIAARLPIQWKGDAISAGKESFPAAGHVPMFIHPNPANPNRYVTINNGCSFRDAHAKSNSLQNPKLPDWAIVDLSQDPDAQTPGKIAAAGFFDEQWQLKQ